MLALKLYCEGCGSLSVHDRQIMLDYLDLLYTSLEIQPCLFALVPFILKLYGLTQYTYYNLPWTVIEAKWWHPLSSDWVWVCAAVYCVFPSIVQIFIFFGFLALVVQVTTLKSCLQCLSPSIATGGFQGCFCQASIEASAVCRPTVQTDRVAIEDLGE